ncbi:MAG: lipoyltransferase [Muribaculaceae bacterium]|nr:lipoyltransferase [Muribaculaceae bacterium]
MLNTILPYTQPQALPYYLAAEEWIARNMPPDEYFFAWQVEPTVICGRNQDVPAEVDIDFCEREGVRLYRRKSGGGAVFADFNNIMFSYIAPASAVQTAFNSYTSRVVNALRLLGLDAEASGRNDITIGGRKVAGNAYWQCAGRSIVHGTMLYDTDPRLMAGALTPSRAKLESNKVVSVPSRITTVRSLRPDISLQTFLNHMIHHICDAECSLPSEAAAGIRKIEEEYYKEVFKSRKCAALARRIEGVGDIGADTRLNHTDGTIASVELFGDFFALHDVDKALATLRGLPPEIKLITNALGNDSLIAGIGNEALATIIADSALE